jgi:protein-tyrosine phosphatase
MPGFAIYDIPAGEGGQIGLCPLPGRAGSYHQDLAQILEWRPDLVLSMTEIDELRTGGASTLIDDLRRNSVALRHLPIRDFGAPRGNTLANWPSAAHEACALMQQGGRVLAHCFGGQGRSGMAVLRLLVEMGEPAEQALARLRTVRPGAVETDEQYAWAAAGAVRQD